MRLLHPCQHICREQRQCAVIVGRIALGIEPAMSSKIFANLNFKADFSMQCSCGLFLCHPAHVDLAGDGGGDESGAAFLKEVDCRLCAQYQSIHLLGY